MSKKKIGVLLAVAASVGALLLSLIESLQEVFPDSSAADSTLVAIARTLGIG